MLPKDGTQAKIGGQSYTIRRIEPAKNADVVSVARAMNREQFAPMLKNVFQPEVDATRRAFETGVYVSWRVDGTDFDCQRVGYPEARCFCMHSLADHEDYVEVARGARGRRGLPQAKCQKCACKAFAWVPSRPEEVGEFWLRKRRNFDPSAWRANCKCKHRYKMSMWSNEISRLIRKYEEVEGLLMSPDSGLTDRQEPV